MVDVIDVSNAFLKVKDVSDGCKNVITCDMLRNELCKVLSYSNTECLLVLKSHFLALGPQKSAFELEWEEKVEAFSKEERKLLLAILKRSLKAK